MDNSQKKLLCDILNSICQIDAYLGTSKMFARYESNPLLQDAVERNLITIGEAMSSLLKLNSGIQISNARRVVDVRNKLTHGYDEIENVQVWSIIINHLPKLKTEVEILLNKKQ